MPFKKWRQVSRHVVVEGVRLIVTCARDFVHVYAAVSRDRCATLYPRDVRCHDKSEAGGSVHPGRSRRRQGYPVSLHRRALRLCSPVGRRSAARGTRQARVAVRRAHRDTYQEWHDRPRGNHLQPHRPRDANFRESPQSVSHRWLS